MMATFAIAECITALLHSFVMTDETVISSFLDTVLHFEVSTWVYRRGVMARRMKRTDARACASTSSPSSMH